MDSQSGGGGGGGGGGSGVGEVRRIHIIYFLSRKGRIEHPHLIRVHHLSRNGVHLRDVKRWLSELRGKDMAEAFAWSYKRRYKTGYVWQDLLDEDLITPISDNEYVLKGSEISSSSSTNNGDANPHGHSSKVKIDQEHPQDPLMQESTQKSTEIDQESPPCSSETSTLTDESTKNEEQEEKTSKAMKENDQTEKNSLYSTLLNKNKNKKTDIDNNSKASKDTIKKSGRNYSIGASNVLRNIITCGAIDTNDSAMVRVDRRDKTSLSTYTSKIIASITPEIRKGEERGGSERISGNVYSNLQQQQQHQSGRKSWDGVKISRKNNSKSEFTSKQETAAAFKPVNGPNCSQCGKPFKPEKLHQHMKSCKGIKAFSTKSPIPTSNILVK